MENLRAKLAGETEKFEQVSKDLEKLMEDDSAAKSALKEARAEIETLRAQLAEAESVSAPRRSGRNGKPSRQARRRD